MVASTASASIDAKKKLTLLQQGQAYYAGKTITFIAPTSAGSANDLNARAVAHEMGIYLRATVNVLDNPTGSGIAGADEMAASTPNGLTIGYISLGSQFYNLITNTPTFNFNPAREDFLGGLPNGPAVVASMTNSSYSSFGTLLSATPSNPISILLQAGSSGLTTEVLIRAFGINAHVISAYSSSPTLAAGFLRGDGPIVGISVSGLISYLRSGIARALALESLTPLPKTYVLDFQVLSSVPTLAQLEKMYPAKTNAEKQARKYLGYVYALPSFMMAAPTKSPAADVRALQWAAKQAITSAYMKATLGTEGNPTGFYAPTAEKATYLDALKKVPALSAILGL